MKRWIIFLPLLLLPLIPMLLRWQLGSPAVFQPKTPSVSSPALRPHLDLDPTPRQQSPGPTAAVQAPSPAATLKPGPSDRSVAVGKGGIYPAAGSETASVPHHPDRDPHPPVRPVTFGPDGVIYLPVDNKPR